MPLLSSKRLMVVEGGTLFVSIRSSKVPRATPTVFPAMSAGPSIFIFAGPYTLLLYGEYDCEKSMTLSRSASRPSVEMTRSTLFVCRYGMRFALVTGTSSSLAPSFFASNPETSISSPSNCMVGPTDPNGAKSCGTATRSTPRFSMSSSASAWTGVKRANALSATTPSVINNFEVFMFPLKRGVVWLRRSSGYLPERGGSAWLATSQSLVASLLFSKRFKIHALGDGRWAMGDRRWAMGDGRWAMGDGRCAGRRGGNACFDEAANRALRTNQAD